jgi:hypothetical protein
MLPTFGRSKTQLPTFIRSAIGMTSTQSAIHFCFCVNRKDSETLQFLNGFNFGGYSHETIIEDSVTPHLANYFNLMYDQTRTKNEPGTAVSMLGDDMIFKTPGWDRTILLWLNRYAGIGVFFCNDTNRAKNNCPVNMFVSRKMVDLTERPFMCPEFEAEMIDIVWYWVGKDTKMLHYFPDVVIHHNHWTRYKEEQWDSTTKRLRTPQINVHTRGGKARAIEIGKQIAKVLLSKGILGDSDC